MSKKKIDFLIVGAQKAGTTSLAKHLDASKEVYIPAEKEIPYFLESAMLQNGWQWYLENYFNKADPACLWGTSTPQYMMHPDCFGSIKSALPEVKIIVTLRDPVRRLVSHFDMANRLGVEKRSMGEAIHFQLSHADECRIKSYPDHTGKYVASGEYGRILTLLYEHFSPSQVLVLFFDDIVSDLQRELDLVSDFLSIGRFEVSAPERVRMQGGAEKRLPLDHNRIILAASQFTRAAGLSQLIPYSLKRRVERVSSWLDEWNVNPASKTELASIPTELLDALQQHYARDAVQLQKIGIHPPWI